MEEIIKEVMKDEMWDLVLVELLTMEQLERLNNYIIHKGDEK